MADRRHIRRGRMGAAAGRDGRVRVSLTEGPIVGALVRLAVPIVMANVLQTVYQLTDTFWVGRLGANAVAAVSLSFPIVFLLVSLGGGISVAGSILVAHNEGRGDNARVNYVAAQTLLILVAASLVLSAIGYAISAPVMRLMGAGPGVLPDAVAYLKISFLGLVFVFAFFVFQSLMRGVGDVKTPVYIVTGTVVLNFALDPLFILGFGPIPAMGVTGAALATISTQALASVVGIGLLFTGKFGLDFRGQRFRLDTALARRILKLGFPASVEQSTRALGLSLMTFLVAGFGSAVIAAYGIGTRILSLVIIPALGLSMATATMVGQNMGARKPERVERVARFSTGLAFVVLTGVGVLFFFLAVPIATAFIPGSPEVIRMSSQFVRIMAFTFGFIGIQQVLNGVFRGSGNTFISMVLAIVTLWVLQFPLAFVLAERTSLREAGIWWAFPIANVIAAGVAYVWYKRGTWKTREVTEDRRLEGEIEQETIIEEGTMR